MTPTHTLALASTAAGGERPREIDHAAARRAARDLLRALGADVDADGLQDTPRRVADAYAELLTPRPFAPTTFPNDDGYDQLIVAGAIPFHSLCMHHMLPFHGVAHVGYLPGERIIGLSKLGRVVEFLARGVQKLGTRTVSSALRGSVRDDARTRQEFLALAMRSSS